MVPASMPTPTARPARREGALHRRATRHALAVILLTLAGVVRPALVPTPTAQSAQGVFFAGSLAIYLVMGVACALLARALHRARRAAEQSACATRQIEERLRLAQLGGNVGVWDWSSDTDESYWSETMWTLYDLVPTPDGKPTRDLWLTRVHPDDRARIQAEVDKAVAAGDTEYRGEYRIVRSDGCERWLQSVARIVRDPAGGVFRLYGSNVDITDRVRTEEALRDADRRKDEFLATLAHELRNPLAPLRNSLHVLRLTGADATARARAVETMERQVHHLVRLVDDLLEISRITRGKIELRKEPVELTAIVRGAVETVDGTMHSSRHRLTISLPPGPVMLEVDPVRLSQVLANLLHNAAKYTDEGGQIWLTAGMEEDIVKISVRDTGMGIPAEMLPRVFDLFAQVDHTLGRAQGGLGIGLALVKRLIQLHGGSVEARSDGPGKGSEFLVRLPRPRTEPRSSSPPARLPPPSALPPRHVLVVDDNRDVADTLGALLEFLGADVEIVYDGAAALAAMRRRRPDVVLLDIGMPGMDGHAVARRVRQDPALQAITLIALSGWGQEEDRRRSHAAGFDRHLVKPVDLGALQALLASIP